MASLYTREVENEKRTCMSHLSASATIRAKRLTKTTRFFGVVRSERSNPLGISTASRKVRQFQAHCGVKVYLRARRTPI